MSPVYPAAVVAGNVEVSQAATNCLYGALGVLAGAYGTMTNSRSATRPYQYMRRSRAARARPTFDGTSVVQCHMTNSRLTDPEVLEFRYPVRVDSHTIHPGTGGARRASRRRWRRPPHPLSRADDRCDPWQQPRQPAARHGRRTRRAAKNWVDAPMAVARDFGHICEVEMQRDDVFVIQTPAAAASRQAAGRRRRYCFGSRFL